MKVKIAKTYQPNTLWHAANLLGMFFIFLSVTIPGVLLLHVITGTTVVLLLAWKAFSLFSKKYNFSFTQEAFSYLQHYKAFSKIATAKNFQRIDGIIYTSYIVQFVTGFLMWKFSSSPELYATYLLMHRICGYAVGVFFILQIASIILWKIQAKQILPSQVQNQEVYIRKDV